ncbi:MAG: FAD-dependent oxidoreductase [Deltaproteobacteria bacterium]|nr:FAD-dependent oxidoreductase [Deltaproteobacteria bacterium]MBW2086025.1 FAD-dependent oxidoreductase [Deltaproteobacteria bacterium]
MNDLSITINNTRVQVQQGDSILLAAQRLGIYIPSLCSHPDLPPSRSLKPVDKIYQGSQAFENERPNESFQGCRLCLVELEKDGEIVQACDTIVQNGMSILTDTERVKEIRENNLMSIMAKHPHACLTCAQREGCTRETCSINVPVEERCCDKFGNCELQKVAEYIGIKAETPRWAPTSMPVLDQDPLFARDYNLCIGCTRCVRVCGDLRGVEALGAVLNSEGEVIVGTSASTLAQSGCKFCTACVEVCPTGALMDKGLPAGKKNEVLVPCVAACPAGIDIPAYVRLIKQGKFTEAAKVIREKVPFPNVLGAICAHPCEEVCRRGSVNEPVAICALKRFTLENETGFGKDKRSKPDSTGNKAAVIGSGPAGLTAAFYLQNKGHQVTVFEAQSELGGMMLFGIPRYRLPKDILARDIEAIIKTGIEVRVNTSVGSDLTWADLQQSGFNAVFISVGAQVSQRLAIEGLELDGVRWAIEFLKEVNLGRPMELKGEVVVIGGGNTAIDAAMTALRLGATSARLICLESREEMPAHSWECDDALAEGVVFHNSWGLKRLLGKDGRVTGLELKKCTSVFDKKGRFAPVYDEAETRTVEADTVLMAIGQTTELAFLDEPGIKLDYQGMIQVDPDTMQTNESSVFAGGDVTRVPGSVIDAVAAGRRAASSIDRYLGGDGVIDEVFFERVGSQPKLGREDDFAIWPRVKSPYLSAEARSSSFDRIDLGFNKEMAVEEAGRCLSCDLRLAIQSAPLPPEKWHVFDKEGINEVPDMEGVYLLADEEKQIFSIKGVLNLRSALEEELLADSRACFFQFEKDKMYTKRETEYMQIYGLAAGGDDLDDLF